MLKKISIPIRYIWKHPITKNNKFIGLSRFIIWQLKSRVNTNSHIINWIGNVKLSVNKSMHGATGCIYVGLPEFNDMSFLLHFLKPDSFFIDIGANIGVYSLLASGIKKCNTISIEPIPQTYNYLNKNIEINHLEKKITSLNIGLSYQEGELYFTSDKDTTNHVVETKTEKTIKINVNTLDNIFPKDISNDILIKLDVEGFEYNVLKGGNNLLKNTYLKAIIVELNGCSERFGLNDGMVDEVLVYNGFKKFNYNPFKRELTEIEKFHTIENTLYLRNSAIAEIKQQLKNAEPYKIFNKTI